MRFVKKIDDIHVHCIKSKEINKDNQMSRSCFQVYFYFLFLF